MEIAQLTLRHTPTSNELAPLAGISPHWILVFGSVEQLTRPGLLETLRAAFPGAILSGCSTAGEISAEGVFDQHLMLTAIHFTHPAMRQATTDLASMDDCKAAGARLAKQLAGEGLHNIVVFAQGTAINGSALIDGFYSVLPDSVKLSGGLAGDGGQFKQTFTLSDHGVSSSQIVAVGFYHSAIRLHHGSFGGWQPFGPVRKVTRASGNILYELDDEPALSVYKTYLGQYAKDLPASGLLFPFEMLGQDHHVTGLIRSILAIDEAQGSLTLAGDVIEHGYMRLMHSSTDALVDGAEKAAEQAAAGLETPTLALLISCVGRKLVMGARVDEEVEAVAQQLGRNAALTGFYSYGEISPLFDSCDCKLHNQTMTVTHISEQG
jgi:hypothetical protein